jgi:epoxide hydrolase-like predicted phosphatase
VNRTAVVFDLGGVLTVAPFAAVEVYGAELGVPSGVMSTYFRGDPQFSALEVGAITAREFFKSVCVRTEERYGCRVDIRRLAAAAEEGGNLNEDMVDLVRDLRGAGFAIGLLTNNVKEAQNWRDALPSELFDAVVDSSAVGLRKPDPAIYRETLDRLGRPGAETVFVDDFEENLPPAADLEMATVLFEDATQCRAALAALGVTAS